MTLQKLYVSGGTTDTTQLEKLEIKRWIQAEKAKLSGPRNLDFILWVTGSQ